MYKPCVFHARDLTVSKLLWRHGSPSTVRESALWPPVAASLVERFVSGAQRLAASATAMLERPRCSAWLRALPQSMHDCGCLLLGRAELPPPLVSIL